ncbi:MAG: hypothetical protein EPN23_11265 [Verrucomicrobia bacterium]|nr:MAG: hypothetical protein EPN23_11265 [Verrucomicrobiota bacterium]
MNDDNWNVSASNRPDYRNWFENSALVLPAIHSSYMNYSGKPDVNSKLIELGYRAFGSFNFLCEDGLYLYDAALYSAGGAELDIEKSKKQTPGIWDRRKDTTLLTDSGGFQVIQGIWSPKEYYEKRHQILAWQEEIGDVAIAMDVPTGCVGSEKAKSIETFDEALDWSKNNFEWQVKNRHPAKSRMLNVVQGLSVSGKNGVMRWYDEVKSFSDRSIWGDNAFDGWSFGGFARDTKAALPLISRMLQDGLLSKNSNHRWIHFLGVTSYERVATFTLLQRALRKVLADDQFTISCDSSNATFAVGKAGTYYTDARDKIATRKVLTARWFQPTCGKDCRTNCSESNPLCGPCLTDRIYQMIEMFGTSTLNFHMSLDMVFELVNFDDNSSGRLSPVGYLSYMFISMEMFLRHVYRRSNEIVAAKEGLVDQLVAAFKSETPESALAKIKLA